MATKKRVIKKKKGRMTASSLRKSLAARLERELPRRVGVYVSEVQALLDRLEQEIQRASRRTRVEATRLLRQASRQLGIVERGQSNWARLVSRYRAEAARVLRTLEGAIAPTAAGSTRKLPTRRASRRARKTTRRSARKRS